MRRWLALLILAGCSVPHSTQKELQVEQSAFVRAVTTPIRERIIPLRYPPGATNYWWDLQTSTDFVNWTTVQTNTGPGDVVVYVTNSEPFRVYRMTGHK